VYAPCSVAALHGSGFDYWALGHIHKRSEDKGPATIVMAGMPQGRDIGEFGPKSVSLVTVHDDRQVLVEQRLTSVAQFERVAVALDGAADLVEVAARMARALGGMRGQVAAPHLVARVRLTGVTELAWRLRCDADLVREQAIACAHSLDARTWIDKIEIDCIAPRGTADSEGVAIDELRQLLEEQVIGSDAYRLKVAAIRDELRGQLPRECRDALGRDEAESAAILDGLVAEGAADVLARLQGREAAGA
jgi:DNA repair exonuclease SbcCD nuclease subunit